jgi:hypothetical protein
MCAAGAGDWLNSWETEFLASVSEQLTWRNLSARQRAVVDRLWTKHTARGQ